MTWTCGVCLGINFDMSIVCALCPPPGHDPAAAAVAGDAAAADAPMAQAPALSAPPPAGPADAAILAALSSEPYNYVKNKIIMQTQDIGAGNLRPIRLLMRLASHSAAGRKGAPIPLSFLSDGDRDVASLGVTGARADAYLAMLARATRMAPGPITAAAGADDGADAESDDNEGQPGGAKRQRGHASQSVADGYRDVRDGSSDEEEEEEEEHKGDRPSVVPHPARIDSEARATARIWEQEEDTEVSRMDDVALPKPKAGKRDGHRAARPRVPFVHPVVTLFDRGHVFAVQWNGDDHPWQIVPQMRSCNRGSWAWMETDIGQFVRSKNKSQWRSTITNTAAAAATTVSAAAAPETDAPAAAQADPVTRPAQSSASATTAGRGPTTHAKRPREEHLGLRNDQTLNEQGEIAGQVFIFYPPSESSAAGNAEAQEHAALLQRIPCWFYVQLYFVCKEGHWGLAHYSIPNGRTVAAPKASVAETDEFKRAHDALRYPAEPREAIEAGTWYPDPPYAALQWLADNSSPAVTRENYTADPFKGAQIAIIRKYNAWLHGDVMRSDYRNDTRQLRSRNVKADVELLQALHDNTQLTVELTAHRVLRVDQVNQIIARLDGERQQRLRSDLAANDMDVTSTFAAFWTEFFPPAPGTLVPVWDSYPAMNRALSALKVKQSTQSARDKNKLLFTRWHQMIDTNRKLLLPIQKLTERRDALMAPHGLQARETLSNWLLEVKAELSEVDQEREDWYDVLSLSGGRSYPEVDHINPKGRSGVNRYDNARLVSFAQNHIYRDKNYLSPEKSDEKKKGELDKCAARHVGEEAKLPLDRLLASHLTAVDAFGASSRVLADLIAAFQETYKVGLRQPTADELAQTEQASAEEAQTTADEADEAQVDEDSGGADDNADDKANEDDGDPMEATEWHGSARRAPVDNESKEN